MQKTKVGGTNEKYMQKNRLGEVTEKTYKKKAWEVERKQIRKNTKNN